MMAWILVSNGDETDLPAAILSETEPQYHLYICDWHHCLSQQQQLPAGIVWTQIEAVSKT